MVIKDVTMKKIVIFLICILIGSVFISCNAEIVNTLPEETVKPDSSDIVVSSSGSTLEIKFSAIAYADQYGYIINGETEHPIEITVNASDNYCSVSVNNVSKPTGFITVYGKTTNSDDWVQIASETYGVSIDDTAPDVFLSVRNETNVELEVNPILDLLYLTYKVEIQGNEPTREIEYDGTDILLSEGKIKIDGLSQTGNYTIIVSHKLVESSEYSPKTTTIIVPAYSINASIELSTTDNAFVINNLPQDTTKVTLYKRLNSDMTSESIVVKDGIDISSSKEIPFSSVLKSLEHGYFYVATENEISNIVNITAPLMPISQVKENYKSAIIEFDFDEAVNTNELLSNVSTTSGTNSRITVEIEGNKVIISGLDSNTQYADLSLDITNNEYDVNPYIVDSFATKSFAGETGTKQYEWTGYFKDEENLSYFRIVVKDPQLLEDPIDSDFPYYVYFAEDDPVMDNSEYTNKELRIMPLIDTKAGDTMPTKDSPIYRNDTILPNYAYKANNSKWNKLASNPLFRPSSWYIETPEITRDRVDSTTQSTAFGMTLPTETSFEFFEYFDKTTQTYKPVIKFRNSSTERLVYSNLNTNADADSGLQFGDENSDEYCFYLEERTTN